MSDGIHIRSTMRVDDPRMLAVQDAASKLIAAAHELVEDVGGGETPDDREANKLAMSMGAVRDLFIDARQPKELVVWRAFLQLLAERIAYYAPHQRLAFMRWIGTGVFDLAQMLEDKRREFKR